MEIINPRSRIDFLGRRRIAAWASGVLMAISCGSFVVSGLNLGIDFTGGTLVEVGYRDAAEVETVRGALGVGGFDDAVVQHFGTTRDILVRLPNTVAREAAGAAGVSSAVMEALRAPHGETLVESADTAQQQCAAGGDIGACQVQMRRVEFVGPQIGDELTNQGGLAMLYALLGILLYVTYRFEWRFAVGSVAALVHDTVITVGIFSLFGLEFSLPVLAAVLAVIGYSLNDTIVVYDRIRENFRKMRKSEVVEIMNTSVNQTLPRTILTSVTTMLVLGTLLVLGGEVIRGFALALLIGVVVGTYSSVFIASPAVLVLGISREDLMPVQKEGEEADPAP